MSEPLLILHLSDLHFGNKSRFAGQNMAALGKLFHKALGGARKTLGIDRRIEFVVVTGDVAETGKPVEFRQGVDFLTALAGELGLEMRRFVFVPGNHDISWAECRKSAIDQENEGFDDAELRRRLDATLAEGKDAVYRSVHPSDRSWPESLSEEERAVLSLTRPGACS